MATAPASRHCTVCCCDAFLVTILHDISRPITPRTPSHPIPSHPILKNLDPDLAADAARDHERECEQQSGVNKYTGIEEEDHASNDHDLDLVGQGTGTGLDPNQDRNEDEGVDEDAPIAEGDCLPEELFHRADIVSQHMIDTREKQRKEKVTEMYIRLAIDRSMSECMRLFWPATVWLVVLNTDVAES